MTIPPVSVIRHPSAQTSFLAALDNRGAVDMVTSEATAYHSVRAAGASKEGAGDESDHQPDLPLARR
jgi:hypothetical protein